MLLSSSNLRPARDVTVLPLFTLPLHQITYRGDAPSQSEALQCLGHALASHLFCSNSLVRDGYEYGECRLTSNLLRNIVFPIDSITSKSGLVRCVHTRYLTQAWSHLAPKMAR